MRKNTRILTLVFVVVFLTLLVGCLPEPPNQAPIITSTPITTAEVGVQYTYNVDATDPDVGDTLTYTLVSKPTNMSISSTTGLINWVPAAPGTFNVVVKVSDGDLDITQSFKITVVEEEEPTPTPSPTPSPTINHAPIITTSPITKAVMGVAYTYDVDATDPDGDALTYSLTTNPSGMGINSANGVIDWIPNAEGDFAVEVKVSDGALSDTQNFTITVQTVVITGIEVLPETMTLVTGTSETIQSVTALYEIKAVDFEVPIPLGDCTYDGGSPVASVVDGVITAWLPGTKTITVGYAGMTDTVVVTVVLPVHNTDSDEYFGTIQGAIVDAETLDSHTIEVAPGIYPENILIDMALTVKSTDGAMGTIIYCNALYGIRIQHSNVTFEGFTVTNSCESTDVSVILVDTLGGESVSNVQILDNIVKAVGASSKAYGVTGINIGNAGNTLSDIVISGNTITDIHNPLSPSNDHTCGINVWDGADNVLISNNDISDIKFNGILLEYASNVQVEGNSITECEVGVRGGTVSDLVINYNNLFGNTEYGVFNDTVTEIDATNNWWGSEFGATYNGFPLDGGDAVSDNVDYSNWSMSPN